jgi:hypothetical protein
VPGRRKSDLALLIGRARNGSAQLLDDTVRKLHAQNECTTGQQRRIKRWEHEAVLDAMQHRLDQAPDIMRIRRQTVEHPFDTLKAWMGAMHFQNASARR